MNNQLEKKYGLFTAISMVVGIVIGSGIFFKAETVLIKTNGNITLGILAWSIVGIIMMICSYVFSLIANQYESSSLIDYAHALLGKRYAFNIGWFMTIIYTPALVAVLSWVCARYTCTLLNYDITSGTCMVLSALYLCLIFAINVLYPKLSGKIQISTTIIKMIPILAMAIIGTFIGLNQNHLINDSTLIQSNNSHLMSAIVSVAFAFEGWILTTSINNELKNSKKNLPLALIIGSIIVVITYIFYYIGICGAVGVDTLLMNGENGVRIAYATLFGNTAGNAIFILIVISCIGTLNGLMIANCRNLYMLSHNHHLFKIFQSVDPYTNMPTNASIVSLALSMLWLFYFYGATLSNWFNPFNFDCSELPIITLYAMYIPLFMQFIIKNKNKSLFNKIMPFLAILGSLFMIYATFVGYGMTVIYYLIVYLFIMLTGNFIYLKKH